KLLSRVLKNQITYAQWIKENNIKTKYKKTHAEFGATVSHVFMTIHLLRIFTEDFSTELLRCCDLYHPNRLMINKLEKLKLDIAYLLLKAKNCSIDKRKKITSLLYSPQIQEKFTERLCNDLIKLNDLILQYEINVAAELTKEKLDRLEIYLCKETTLRE